jgi:plastocyanin
MRTRLIAAMGLAALGIGVTAPLASGSKVVKNVSLVDFAFKPKKLTINKGSAVKWTWASGVTQLHNVTLVKAPSGVKKRNFTSTSGVHHKPFQRTFTKAGTYNFICTYHPFMTLKVVVR